MECPHCQKEMPAQACPGCGGMIPLGGRYCMYCGMRLESGKEDFREDAEFDIESRVLCEDGTCTGIIIDGKCTECGKGPQQG